MDTASERQQESYESRTGKTPKSMTGHEYAKRYGHDSLRKERGVRYGKDSVKVKAIHEDGHATIRHTTGKPARVDLRDLDVDLED